MYDLIIKNGRIIDGTGTSPYYSDLAIKNGKITSIAPKIAGGKKVIDASGLTVTPGFIDSHSHSDADILMFPDQVEKAEQGITTSIGGQCGATKAPSESHTKLMMWVLLAKARRFTKQWERFLR